MSRGPRFLRPDEAAAMVSDGATIGLGGILQRRRPAELCRALAASGVRNLHVMSFLAGPETEFLAAAGAVAVLTTGYVDPTVPPTATEAGIASGSIVLHEASEHIFVGGLLAASAGLPFWPTLGAVGTDVAAELALREVRCPYTDRPVLAVSATPLDVAVLHAEAATESGAVLGPSEREFLDDADLALARAARQVIVSVERIVADREALGCTQAVLAPFEVTGIVHLGAARA
jgi:glutaconate CoA-transferase subunit A